MCSTSGNTHCTVTTLPGAASILTTSQSASIINVSPHKAAYTHQTDADTYNVHNLVVHLQYKAAECQNSWDGYTVQQLKERFEPAASKMQG